MASLPDRIVELHETLLAHEIEHAFGGALALAWCTRRARGTIDIDINIFLPVDRADEILEMLPEGVKVTRKDRQLLKREGQVRVWWEKTPVDLFLNTTPYHADVANRVRWERFMDRDVPFLSCQDLAVFKAFFNRGKDWVDVDEMIEAGTLDVGEVMATLIEYLGADDERIAELQKRVTR